MLPIPILFLALVPLSCTAISCGEYCSIEHVKPYFGDIRPSINLHAWLDSVSHKKELIILHFTQGDRGDPDIALQFHHELITHGLGHHSFLGLRLIDCERLRSFRPHLSCVYDSTSIPDWVLSGETLLWHFRMKLAARSIRLGYNLIMMDLDSIFFRPDIYSFLQSPPLSKVNFMCLPESGSPNYNCNVGFLRFQNVRSNGPVSWVFKEVVWNLLRRADDHYEFLSKWTNKPYNLQTFDQSWVFDALTSAAVGLRLSSMLTHQKGEIKYIGLKGQELTPNQVRDTMGSFADGNRKMVCTYPRPEELLSGMGLSDIPYEHKKFCSGNLTVPNLSYGFPDELGGRAWPEGPPGNFSSDFERMLKEDCPQCPDWPEYRPMIPQDQFREVLSKKDKNNTDLQLFLDPSIPNEVFAMAPPWLAVSILLVRTGTLTGPNNKHHQGYPLVGHMHRWGDMGDPYYYKLETRKIFGRYNYSLGYELLRERGEPGTKIYAYGKALGSKAVNLTKVIALSPRIDLRRTRTWSEFASIIYGLLQVARLSGRIMVLPDLPCETPWLYSVGELSNPDFNTSLCLAPLTASEVSWNLQYPVDPSTGELIGGWRKRRMIRRRALSEALNVTRDPWWSTHQFKSIIPQSIGEACIHLATMVKPEFVHWLKHEGRQGHSHPIDSNTVFRLQNPDDEELQLKPKEYRSEGAGLVYRPSSDPGWSWYDVQAQMTSADVVAEMQRVHSEAIVYLDHPVLVKLLDSSSSSSDKVLQGMHEQLMVEVKESRVCFLLIDHDEWLKTRKMVLPNTDHGLLCLMDETTGKLRRAIPRK